MYICEEVCAEKSEVVPYTSAQAGLKVLGKKDKEATRALHAKCGVHLAWQTSTACLLLHDDRKVKVESAGTIQEIWRITNRH